MTDPDRSRAQATGERARDAYEPPRLTIIGPLEKITLGSTGTKSDKATMKSK
jgi:hypothetical protein